MNIVKFGKKTEPREMLLVTVEFNDGTEDDFMCTDMGFINGAPCAWFNDGEMMEGDVPQLMVNLNNVKFLRTQTITYVPEEDPEDGEVQE